MRRALLNRVTAIACMAWLVAIFGTGSAQEWVKLREEGANFYDIQRSFNQYWEGREVEKGKGWKQYKRWEYWTAPRAYPSGILPEPDFNTKAFQQYLQRHGALMKGAATPSLVTTAIPAANWTSLGPNAWTLTAGSVAPGLGRVSAIAFHPTNSSIIFLGTPAGGLWKTTDGGVTWSTNTDNLTVLGISAIVIDPTNTNIMYIATGDYDSNDTYSIGVLKSTDGGATWNTTGLNWTVTQSRTISKLLMHPTNSSILLAATSSGVWKTINAGVSWTNPISGNYKDMEFKPGDPATVYLASGLSFRKSTNTGDTWTQITNGVPASGFNRINIGVSPANANYVYLLAGKSSDSGFLGLYRSTDSGVSFTTQSTTPNILSNSQDGSGVGGQSWYDLALAVSPTNADEIYAGGVNIWKSTDGGVTWTIKAYWVYSQNPASWVHSDVHLFEFNGSNLYIGTDGGFFKSTDGATTVTDLSAGMQIMQFVRLGSYAGSANLVYGGAQGNGINRYTGSTGSWFKAYGGDGSETFVDYTNSNIVYASTQGGSIVRSTNAGASFSSIKNNINESGAWTTPWVMDPVTPTTLYAGYVNVWKTTTSGVGATAWTNLTNGAVGTGTFVDLQVAPSNSNYIYGVKSTTVYKTINGGTAWTDITAGLPTAAYTQIAVAGNDPQKIWITMSGYNTGNKVYASTNGGTTWTNYSGTLPNLPFNTIVYHNNGGNDALYAGADVGVYYRDNTMSDWELYQTGLPNVPISELEIHQNSGKLRAATFGRGLWQTDLVPPPGAALAFDGTNDYVSSPTVLSTATANVTLEAWVKWDGFVGDDQVVFFNGSSGIDGYGFYLSFPSGTFTGLLGGVTASFSAVSPTVGVWTHLAMVGSGTTWTLYKDGVSVHSFSGTPNTPTTGFGIGASFQLPGDFFKGTIDEVRFWNVARSQADIQAKMNCELTGTEANLVAYYKFNQGVAGSNNAGVTTLTDIAGGDNNGTLSNFALTGTTSNWVTPGGVASGTTCTMAALAVNAGNDIPHSGGATKLNGLASGGSGGYTYAWAVESGPNAGSEQFNNASSPATIFKPAAKGNYVLRFTVNDGMNATASDNVAVTVNALSTASISGDDPVLPGSTHIYTVTTDASNPSYLWTVTNGTIVDNNDQSSVEVEAGGPQSPMLVEVFVTDGVTSDVVYALKSVTVSNPFALTANAGADRAIVTGGSTTLGGTPAASGGIDPITYEWSPTTGLNDPSLANPLAQPATTTTYLLTVTDGYNTIATDEVTVTVNVLVVKPFVFVGNKVTLKKTKQSTPAGDIHSNGLLTVEKGTPSTYNSNLTAIGKITINKQNTINGNVKSQTSISNSGTITGTTTIGPVASEPLPSLIYSAGGANKTVPQNGTLTLAPGSYNTVTLNSFSKLKLTSGDYYFTSLKYNSSTTATAVIEIDLSSGNPVTLNVVSNLYLGNEVEIRLLPNGEASSKLVTFNSKQTTAMTVGRQAYFLGNLNAPNAVVTLDKNSQLRGTICAKEIVVNNDCLFLHHNSSGSLPGPGNLPRPSGNDEETGEQSPVTSYELAQNYPNPFNPETEIRFALPEASHVTLAVYSLSGQVVKQLAGGHFAGGQHQVIWDGRDASGAVVAGGIYFCRFTARGEDGEMKFTQTRKMIFVK